MCFRVSFMFSLCGAKHSSATFRLGTPSGKKSGSRLISYSAIGIGCSATHVDDAGLTSVNEISRVSGVHVALVVPVRM